MAACKNCEREAPDPELVWGYCDECAGDFLRGSRRHVSRLVLLCIGAFVLGKVLYGINAAYAVFVGLILFYVMWVAARDKLP